MKGKRGKEERERAGNEVTTKKSRKLMEARRGDSPNWRRSPLSLASKRGPPGLFRQTP